MVDDLDDIELLTTTDIWSLEIGVLEAIAAGNFTYQLHKLAKGGLLIVHVLGRKVIFKSVLYPIGTIPIKEQAKHIIERMAEIKAKEKLDKTSCYGICAHTPVGALMRVIRGLRNEPGYP